MKVCLYLLLYEIDRAIENMWVGTMKIKNMLFRPLLLGLLSAFPLLVSAHPHIFIDSYYKVVVNNNQVNHLEAMWLVDDFTSSSIILGYDINMDGQILGQEKQDLITAFGAFKEQAYFLKIEQDRQPLAPHAVRIADLQVRNDQLWLRLDIILPELIDLSSSTLSLAFGDDTMYTALTPEQNGLVQLAGTDAENCTPMPRLSEAITIDSWADLRCD